MRSTDIGTEGRDRDHALVNRLKNDLTSKQRHGLIPRWGMSMDVSDAGVLKQNRRQV